MENTIEKKGFVQLGGSLIDLSTIVKDPRGIEDRLAEVIREDFTEPVYQNFGFKLYPFADAQDIADWDQAELNVYSPLYTESQSVCTDCSLGSCDLNKRTGKCGLELDSYKARLGLRTACKGCLFQMIASRDLLNYAIKVFGGDKVVSMGQRHDMSDHSPNISILTGIYVKNLDDLDIALSYAEAQLNKLSIASCSGVGSSLEFESKTFHAGSLILLAMEVAEMVKISCFDFYSADNQLLEELRNWPPVSAHGGLGSIEKGKPVIAFWGDNFLPAWSAIKYLEGKGLEGVEICGLGPVGHDILRFYEKCRIISTMEDAAKAIRTGFADVIVASNSCVPVDVMGEARRVESKLIWVGTQGIVGLEDRTEDSIEEIIKSLLNGVEGVWIRDVEKAGEVAARIAGEVRRKGGYSLSEEEAQAEAKKCTEDCDLCFNVCPNSLMIGRAVRKIKEEGLQALMEVESGCSFCGKCEDVCPENISLRDIIVAAKVKQAPEEKFVMRPGRGPISRVETASGLFSSLNSPGFVSLMGCGGTKHQGDIGWIANELTAEGCYVTVAGCAAGEIARYYDKEEQKFIYEKFTCEYQPRNLINCGGFSAISHQSGFMYHTSRTGTHVSHYGDFARTADLSGRLVGQASIMWGVPDERMYAVAAGFARAHDILVVGPASAFEWNRYLLGNHHDRSKWQLWDTSDGRKVEIEPCPEHMIIPVETKEEAVTMMLAFLLRSADVWDSRHIKLDAYIGHYENYFGELPDDWQLFIRAHTDLAPKRKVRLLRELQEKYGWEIEKLSIKKARHRDGRLMSLAQFSHEYGVADARFNTRLLRLVSKAAKEKLAKEGVEI